MIIVMGIPGAGKTTLLNNLKLGEYKIVNYGDLMFEEAQKEGIKDRDQMRKQPLEFQKRIQRKVVERIVQMGEKVILDTHCSIKTPEGYLPGLPYEILKNFNPSHLVLVTAKPEEILERRRSDTTRKRDDEELESISEHEKINLALLACYGMITGATIVTIENKKGELQQSVDKIQKLLKN